MQGISQREFARRDGCSHPLVRRALTQGKLVAFDDGSIDPALVGSAWLRGNYNAKSVPHCRGDIVQFETFADAQKHKEGYQAKLRELEFLVKSGRLVEADTARTAVFAVAREYRDALLSWSVQTSPLMAAELGVDQVKFGVMYEKYIVRYLTERSQRPPPAPPA